MSASTDTLHDRLEAFLRSVLAACNAGGLDTFGEMDLSMSQVRTLFVVAMAPAPLAIHEVAQQVGLSIAAAGRTVDSLVRLDALDRRENPDDRRVKLVALTAHGQAIVDSHIAHKRRALRTFVDRLPGDVAEQLDSALITFLASDAAHEPDKDPQ